MMQPELKLLAYPLGLCQCGCGNKTSIARFSNPVFQHRKGQPVYYLTGHHSRVPIEQRFWKHVNRKPGDGCWEWTGFKDRYGYGFIHAEREFGKPLRAHRYSWFLHYGSIQGTGPYTLSFVCHKCDNPGCVRPSHLFLGTQSDNLRDMSAKGRGSKRCSKKTSCPEGHPYNEENTLHISGRRVCRICSAAKCKRYRLQRNAKIKGEAIVSSS